MLFKYSAKPLLLDDGFIRFTQPGALNDPEDSLPEIAIDVYSAEDYHVAGNRAHALGLPLTSDEELEQFLLAPYPADRFDERSFPGLWPMFEPRLREAPFGTLKELDEALAQRAVELYLGWANQSIGVLSLTKSTTETMWAHYAAGHTGVAIGFAEEHAFFAEARPVIYSDLPVRISSNGGIIRFGGVQWRSEDILNRIVRAVPRDVLFRKRYCWAQEDEWRMLADLSEAKIIAEEDTNGYPIHLFDVPKDAVKMLVFGYRSKDELVHNTLKIIAESWNHLIVRRRCRTPVGTIDELQLWP
jgi:hypothetical protein